MTVFSSEIGSIFHFAMQEPTLQNWRSFLRIPYAATLVVTWLAAWMALPNPRDENSPTTTAAVLDATAQKRANLTRAANLVIAMSSEFRKEQGLEAVQVNSKLIETASYFADYMADTDKYSHTADGKTPSERASEHEYDYCVVSENIAYVYRSAGFSTEELAARMVNVWKESPEHRKNMLDPAITETGVAVTQSHRTGRFYGVQMFGRPKSLSIRFAVENRSAVPIQYSVGERTFELPPHNRHTHEECLAVDVTFQLPGEAKPERTVRPQNGDHFIISGPPEVLMIQKALREAARRRWKTDGTAPRGQLAGAASLTHRVDHWLFTHDPR
jgi:uncharacterized protein YkwD